jgi:Rab3 GTPase-activating protein catalytic subunit
VLPGSNIEFAMVHLKRTPAQYNHLAGLLDVFKSKLVSTSKNMIDIIIVHKISYCIKVQ